MAAMTYEQQRQQQRQHVAWTLEDEDRSLLFAGDVQALPAFAPALPSFLFFFYLLFTFLFIFLPTLYLVLLFFPPPTLFPLHCLFLFVHLFYLLFHSIICYFFYSIIPLLLFWFVYLLHFGSFYVPLSFALHSFDSLSFIFIFSHYYIIFIILLVLRYSILYSFIIHYSFILLW